MEILRRLQPFLRISTIRVSTLYCLGDVVGYGPNPCECLATIPDRCEKVILGNHDQGALFDPDGFNVGAERAIRWTRDQIESHDQRVRRSEDNLFDFLGELPRSFKEGEVLFVHGSARRPLDEYVFPEDIYNPLKLKHIFELITRLCFQVIRISLECLLLPRIRSCGCWARHNRSEDGIASYQGYDQRWFGRAA